MTEAAMPNPKHTAYNARVEVDPGGGRIYVALHPRRTVVDVRQVVPIELCLDYDASGNVIGVEVVAQALPADGWP